MRGIQQSFVVPTAPDRTWAWLSQPANWNALADAFSWPRTGLRHADAAAPALGAEITLKDAGGRALWVWKVSEWVPPSRIALVARTENVVGGFHMQWAFKLEANEPGTKIDFGYFFLMHNSALELLSLVPPFSTMYGKKADRIVDALKRELRQAA
ncbi:MAG: SRPBCC family protein [Elusimicrobia bacterium]|nr:SRPBCC family protein [Elusimicrobiota bacterium]